MFIPLDIITSFTPEIEEEIESEVDYKALGIKPPDEEKEVEPEDLIFTQLFVNINSIDTIGETLEIGDFKVVILRINGQSATAKTTQEELVKLCNQKL